MSRYLQSSVTIRHFSRLAPGRSRPVKPQQHGSLTGNTTNLVNLLALQSDHRTTASLVSAPLPNTPPTEDTQRDHHRPARPTTNSDENANLTQVEVDAFEGLWPFRKDDQATNQNETPSSTPVEADAFEGIWSLRTNNPSETPTTKKVELHASEGLRSLRTSHPDKTAIRTKLNTSDFQGIWSLRKYDRPYDEDKPVNVVLPDSPKSEPSCNGGWSPFVGAPTEHGQGQSQNQNQNMHTFESLWTATPRPKKVDLSSWDPAKYGAGQERSSARPINETFAFRAHKGGSESRRITKFFMQHVYHHTSADIGVSDAAASLLLREYASSQPPTDMQIFADCMAWSWVLLATPPYIVKRLVVLADQRQNLALSPVPLWVVMQILRVERLDPNSLVSLLSFLASRASQWLWLGNDPIIVTIRLLRHARANHNECTVSIINFFLVLLNTRFSNGLNTADLSRLTHWCNRILSLLSLPADLSNLESMTWQQESQLTIIKYMQDHRPKLPLTREGYRALARLQLMHSKTEDEREWAQAKSVTWPPWELRNQMGAISKPAEYPGKVSRVGKVLRQMQVDGFCPGEFDSAMQILAGWDTDGSPTVQSRRQSTLLSSHSPWKPANDIQNPADSHLIWTARVEATRTKREAWMCFCSYSELTRRRTQHVNVYAAMFRKLLAEERVLLSEDDPLPGDGPETYPDPELDRDKVYIPEDIPSIQDLFATMLRRGVRPDPSLLTELLYHETSLTQGLQYMQHAHYDGENSKALGFPQSYTVREVATALKPLPRRLVRAYINLLARPNTLKTGPKHYFGGSQHLQGPFFAKAVLEAASINTVSIWNGYLWSLSKHSDAAESHRHRLYVEPVWELACEVLYQTWNATPHNFRTLSSIQRIAFTIQNLAKTYTPSPQALVLAGRTWFDSLDISKRLFMKAASGSGKWKSSQWSAFCSLLDDQPPGPLHSIPVGRTIESMVWVLGANISQFASSLDDILNLLRWVHRYRIQITADGRQITQENLAAFRVFLDCLWVGVDRSTTWPELDLIAKWKGPFREEIHDLGHDLGGWPDDQYMQEYLSEHAARLERLRNGFLRRNSQIVWSSK